MWKNAGCIRKETETLEKIFQQNKLCTREKLLLINPCAEKRKTEEERVKEVLLIKLCEQKTGLGLGSFKGPVST